MSHEWEDKVNAQDWTTEDKANSQVYWTKERLLKRAARKGQFDDADKVYKKKSKTRKHKHTISTSWKKETLKKTYCPKIPDAGEVFKPDPEMQIF